MSRSHSFVVLFAVLSVASAAVSGNLYSLLGVARKANENEIKKAYRVRSKEL